ncbi:hypothetical protein Q5H93_05520 [Hymenobacter sp. ASUV-10]|uniref:Uncharacterized protein n=1 Tax=Hymenobacter aranciens TaxID=3063996 RepID=A0ABT9B7D7_9BACT|nr:hypothetical protein [Hymenobacter sp. ASUV-10]MDO7874184.1 hypothetical protein [Hymenobacter sp. ASUV-10]
MATNISLAQKLCVLLIVHQESVYNESANNYEPANSYQLVRWLSRLFGIISFDSVKYLVQIELLDTNDDGASQFSEYWLTEAGLQFLQLHKNSAFQIIQEAGHIKDDYSRSTTELFISRIEQ